MTHIKFESSSIKSIGYAPERNIMVVAFSSGAYIYYEVPWGVALSVLFGEQSVGKSVQSLIVKGGFEYEKIDPTHASHPEFKAQSEEVTA